MKQDKLKLAYYAGFMDGEGSFVIVRRNAPDKGYKYGVQLTGRVTVANTYKPVLEEIQEYFDEGSIYKNNRGTNKICYRLDIQRHEGVVKIVEQLLPFLKEKKKRAEILLQFCKRRKLLCAKRGKRYPYYVTDDFEDYFCLRELNKVGTIPYQRESIISG